MRDYMSCVKNLSQFSKSANIFILIHKMDKIGDTNRNSILEKKKNDIIAASLGMCIKQIFATSIWDETLFEVLCEI